LTFGWRSHQKQVNPNSPKTSLVNVSRKIGYFLYENYFDSLMFLKVTDVFEFIASPFTGFEPWYSIQLHCRMTI
jgi:hypothetical protein